MGGDRIMLSSGLLESWRSGRGEMGHKPAIIHHAACGGAGYWLYGGGPLQPWVHTHHLVLQPGAHALKDWRVDGEHRGTNKNNGACERLALGDVGMCIQSNQPRPHLCSVQASHHQGLGLCNCRSSQDLPFPTGMPHVTGGGADRLVCRWW